MLDLDLAIGIELRLHDWPPIEATISRPEGFKVIEEVDGKPCSQWTGLRDGKFAVYLLKKRGIDHFSVISRLSSVLKERPGYLGIKDANAITEQLIYTRRKIIESYSEQSFSIEFRGFIDGKINHTGNIFEIELITENKDEVKERAEILRREGLLPAFIGYQRFGTRRPITHLVGKAITERDWCKAVEYILGYPFIWENVDIKKFRLAYMEGRVTDDLLERIPKQERSVYLELARGNCLSALKKSSVKPSFYVEAYQSYLFNRILSRKLLRSKIFERDEILVPTKPEDCDTECREVFDEEGIDKGSFYIEEVGVNLRPLRRKAFMNVSSIRVDVHNNLKIMFSLERGMYATLVLSEILNTDPKNFT
ncbi:tRNA pseudouridine(13) synthase TruD [Metallosphaera hakonensis]|uniref:tRNA pseudouridine(13) synthase TruD n=1 Tax=Metallosphaera hakonensis JCM 8857 = DSM 7519 TaxID=1293036 RepID=A0A2U9ITI9_9CREN|nr:tRNA pseudouridine(13) synthase TruD [Metallosphaera hakonensis]AWR99295.1 tRNA pseudouridine(13) synthase TruD [Metallosphaera hakonensis JCM 8857 = DSM 7519]